MISFLKNINPIIYVIWGIINVLLVLIVHDIDFGIKIKWFQFSICMKDKK